MAFEILVCDVMEAALLESTGTQLSFPYNTATFLPSSESSPVCSVPNYVKAENGTPKLNVAICNWTGLGFFTPAHVFSLSFFHVQPG